MSSAKANAKAKAKWKAKAKTTTTTTAGRGSIRSGSIGSIELSFRYSAFNYPRILTEDTFAWQTAKFLIKLAFAKQAARRADKQQQQQQCNNATAWAAAVVVVLLKVTHTHRERDTEESRHAASCAFPTWHSLSHFHKKTIHVGFFFFFFFYGISRRAFFVHFSPWFALFYFAYPIHVLFSLSLARSLANK